MDEINHDAFLLLGGNIGNREHFLSKARQDIEEQCGTINRASSIYETVAWGKKDQDKFLNQVLHLQTSLSAKELLTQILQIEKSTGRQRQVKYGPRVIDIDILFYNDNVVRLEGLTIPHPELQNRRFVLVPLSEIAPAKIHPLLKKTVSQLLQDCADQLDVNKFN